MIFKMRLGFSGTPSNLLPVELGNCNYEDGDDAKMIYFLTHPDVVQYEVMPNDWKVPAVTIPAL